MPQAKKSTANATAKSMARSMAKLTMANSVKTARMPKTAHHCPVCNQGCTFRCEKKGHVVRCEIHPEHLYGSWYQCGSCVEADRRKIEQDRKAKRERKQREEKEASEKEAAQTSRKKDRCPDKRKKRQDVQRE